MQTEESGQNNGRHGRQADANGPLGKQWDSSGGRGAIGRAGRRLADTIRYQMESERATVTATLRDTRRSTRRKKRVHLRASHLPHQSVAICLLTGCTTASVTERLEALLRRRVACFGCLLSISSHLAYDDVSQTRLRIFWTRAASCVCVSDILPSLSNMIPRI